MAKKRLPERLARQHGTDAPKPSLPPIPAEAALSFLKDTKGTLTWSLRDLADTLKIGRRDAEQVIALLAAQGYVQRASGADQWMTTPAGESVSGAKPPRFTRESVEQAVASLKERIKQVNKDSQAAFRITVAVAFGDFLLSDRARVQAAEVGIALALRDEAAGEGRSASAARLERQFLRQIRGKTALLHTRPYADWMSKRSHLNLM
jgi:DNA-binding transcriptional MocR family regulator